MKFLGRKKTVFLDAVYTKSISHNAQFVAESIKTIIEKRQGEGIKYAGYITDNTSANKAAWRILEANFPDKYFYGCVCHVLHLVVKMICTKIAFLKDLEKECKNVVKFFKGSNLERARLKILQDSVNVPNLVLPGDTRWGSLLKCFNALLASKLTLEEFTNDDSFIARGVDRQGKEKREKIRNFIHGGSFNGIRSAIKILSPVCNLITSYQNDKKPISDVFESFYAFCAKNTQG